MPQANIEMQQLPHHGVYVRLGPSKLHGIGVIAIQPISKGVQVFYGDDADLVWVDKAAVQNLPPPVLRLYQDFCVLKEGRYGCPANFNHLTPAWYLNHSKTPNVAADKEYRFYSLRPIAEGEELTADYTTYSGSSEVFSP